MTSEKQSIKMYFVMLLKIIGLWSIYFLGQIVIGGIFGFILYAKYSALGGDMIGFQQRLSQNLPIILILAALFSFMIYWFIFIGKKRSLFNHCQFKKIKMGSLAVLTMMTIGLVIFSISMLNLTGLYQYASENVEMLSMAILSPSILLSLLSIGVIIPFVEEVVYRGLIFNELRDHMHVWSALLFQALIFAMSHGNLAQGINTLIMGLLLGLVYIWLESLWAPIIIHVLNNSFVVLLSNYAAEDFEAGKAITVVTLCFGILVVMIGIVKLHPKKDEVPIIEAPNSTLE